MRTRILMLAAVLGMALAAHADTHNAMRSRYYRMRRPQADTLMVKAYEDSLAYYKAKVDSLSRVADNATFRFNSNYFKLFAPLTYYRSVAKGSFADTDVTAQGPESQVVNSVLMRAYLQCPSRVRSTEEQLQRMGALHEEIKTPIKHKVELSKDEDMLLEEKTDMPLHLVVEKPNFWSFSGDYYLQFLQNYISGNWYKGGESNYSMVASATLQANYNNKQKVKFENKLELKLGFQTSRGDTLHSFKTSEDLIRYTGKLGLQASKNWYYTLQLVAYTQFLRGYKSNDPYVYSDLMSPFNSNLSIGMSYNVDAFDHKLKGSIQMAPLAYNFRYVSRKELGPRYGIDEGKHVKHDFGSECTFDLTWQLSELIKWKTRLYGYTTYERAEIEWENTISFQFNKYISSNIFIYPRFDDGTSTRDDHHGYWQFKEYASIGFAYSF
ncbi:MAG: DUF3078 domain-containing protein [Bacteroidales bacterium]|nr:DUF3078 domain-containing protein [Bacteroidales bacterium]